MTTFLITSVRSSLSLDRINKIYRIKLVKTLVNPVNPVYFRQHVELRLIKKSSMGASVWGW